MAWWQLEPPNSNAGPSVSPPCWAREILDKMGWVHPFGDARGGAEQWELGLFPRGGCCILKNGIGGDRGTH